VSWRAHDDVGIVTQEIWLSTDGGETYAQLVGDPYRRSQRYALRLPLSSAATDARVKIIARDGSVQRGELTSESFRIAARQVRIPAGAEGSRGYARITQGVARASAAAHGSKARDARERRCSERYLR
jgi:hypothetical protein